VAIARLFLKNAPILLFDEPTSALDTNTEKRIMDQLRGIAQDKTCIIIAHRLSTIMDADQIIVLGGPETHLSKDGNEKSLAGRIVERGTHQELLSRGGVYAQMWYMQQQQHHHPSTETEEKEEML
jgi:ABC-type transport system involved in Fe-S cluster assembly fused permease/ATPase subunit